MKKVEFTPDTLPPLTDTQKADLRALSRLEDAAIDTSNAPELSDAQLARTERGALYRPIKKQITARVDADVLEWLKSGGKGYQSRMNTILREAMLKGKSR